MHLNFVVVQNGSFDINTIRDGKPSSFTSSNNNFDLQGLQIQQNALRALTVERFAMAIRNYETFLRDSSYAVSFDSILLNNNRISLSNFSFRELSKGRTINSLSMPQFELQGLSWDELVFDQYLKAENVILFQPVINYSAASNKNNKQQNVFQVLEGIGKIMQLNNLYVVNGELNLYLKNNSLLRLQNTNMSILGQNLVNSNKIAGIYGSVPELNFKSGHYKTGNLTADLSEVKFNGTTGQLRAASIIVKDKATINASANDVTINEMLIGDAKTTILKGVSWKKADLRFFDFPGPQSKTGDAFLITGIRGSDTRLSITGGQKKITVMLDGISANQISRDVDAKPIISGLVLRGNTFQYADSTSSIRIKDLSLSDLGRSTLNNFSYKNIFGADSISIIIPAIALVPDLNAFIKGTIKTGNTSISRPVISISRSATEENKNKPLELPRMFLDRLTIEQPVIHYTNNKDGGNATIDWNGTRGKNTLVMDAVNVSEKQAGELSADKIALTLSNFLLTDTKGKEFNAGQGLFDLELSKINAKKNEIGEWDWHGTVNHLYARNFILDSLGKQNGRLTITSANLQALTVGSSSLLNIKDLVKKNTSFSLSNLTGSYYDANDQFNWYNAGYQKQTRTFSIDSFAYRPALDRDSFMAVHPYQADHVTLTTGAVNAGPFDIDRYLQDTILDAGIVRLNNVHLENYRDQRPPRLPGLVKLLPANTLKHLPLKITIDTIILSNALIEYEELNEKTNKAGKVAINDLNAKITHVKNFELDNTDSLRIIANANIAGVIPTKLQIKESYTDTSGGFLMTATMSSADLTVLNPILIPLLSAELRSGQLDTMTMQVVGRDRFAYGKMQMLYHDLKVRVLKDGEPNRKTFLTGIFNFVANTVVKNKNTGRTGNVFFERLRDRSAANYLFKITLSGVASNVGAKSHKKAIRRNRKELRAKS
jgi:hypothetical protein